MGDPEARAWFVAPQDKGKKTQGARPAPECPISHSEDRDSYTPGLSSSASLPTISLWSASPRFEMIP
jgi:hypothetical protein